MAKGYRNQMTPGLKKCIDYMKGNKMKQEEDKGITNKPPQVYKQNKNKYARSDEAGKANIEKQVKIIQEKIRALQSKMEKDAQQNPGKSKAYPVIKPTAVPTVKK